MSTTAGVVIPQCEYWMRVGLALQLCVKEALLVILHNRDGDSCYNGLPEDENNLYNRMIAFKNNYQNKLKNVIRQDQWDVLCPSSGKSNSGDWDITLIVVIIQNDTDLPAPKGGWKQKIPDVNDNSKAAFCLRARQLRNEFNHGSVNDFQTQTQFNVFWTKIEDVLNGLFYQNMVLFKDLESGPLQEFNKKVKAEMELLKAFMVDLEAKRKKEKEEIEERFKLLEEKTGRGIKSRKGSDQTVKAALFIVADRIGASWYSLAYALGMTHVERLKIEAMIWFNSWRFSMSNKDKMMAFFESRKFEISWWLLKDELKNVEREDIISEVLKDTVVLKGLEDAINAYKAKLLEALRTKQEQNSFHGPDGLPIYESLERQQSFVELAVVKQNDVDKSWMKSDRDYHIQQMALEKISIRIDDILTTDYKFVLVNGIAGIGKSTLIEMLVYRWSEGILFNHANEKSPNIKLLLYTTCRELNWMDIGVNASFEEVFYQVFERSLGNVDKKCLEEIKGSILIIIDGIDELHGFDGDGEMIPISKFVMELVDPGSGGFLHGKSVIVAGRPGACRKLRKQFEKDVAVRKVEVFGFNSEGVEDYIKKRFDDCLCDSILKSINESDTVKIMVRIPVYLWIVTSLYKDFDSIQKVETTTELLLYACLIFIRNHWKKEKYEEMSLEEICENDNILKQLAVLSEFSYQTLKEKKVLFPVRNVKDLNLQETGFVVKSRCGEFGECYQFRHLILQELFCALYLFSMPFEQSDVSLEGYLHGEGCLRGCVPLVAGMEGLIVTQRNKLLMNLLNNFLKQHGRKHSKLMSHVENEATWLYQNVGISLGIPRIFGPLNKKMFSFTILHGEDTYLQSFFEYHSSLSPEMHKYFIDNTNGLEIRFRSHPGVVKKWLLYYIEQYGRLKPVRPLSVNIQNADLTEKEALILARHVSNFHVVRCHSFSIEFQEIVKGDPGSSVSDTIVLKSLADHLNNNKSPLKELCLYSRRFAPVVEPDSQVARIIPFVQHLEIPVNLIKFTLDTLDTFIDSHGTVFVKDLVISGTHHSKIQAASLADVLGDKVFQFCIHREDMSRLYQCFSSICIRPFAYSSNDDAKVLEYLENSTSDLAIFVVKSFKLHSMMSDETFMRLIDDFRLFENVNLQNTMLTMSSINFLEKKLIEWKSLNMKYNLKNIEISSSERFGQPFCKHFHDVVVFVN